MAVISLVSSKGGCGKSTAAIVLAGAFQEQDYKVRIVDADPKERIMRWAEAGQTGPKITVATANAQNIGATVKAAEAEADIVIIDVEGSANMVVPLAITLSNLVLVPANQSAPDVEDAISTVKLIRQTYTSTGKPPPYALLWSRTGFQFRSHEIALLESEIAESEIPVLGRIPDRTAYKALFSYGTTLDRLPKDGPKSDKAREEAGELAEAVTKWIIDHQQAAEQ